ncbi:hypothetical protein [Falsigemmobacter faecalis]|uniref:Uncharacterized protein n=1 Tax=Falsigemmobacter faecalis TaxID=2488730 RepID=A0A3P3DAB1_9RHOB|nr:hypothetical protein [Falsigemmobacter faecalis]RRH71287.1 hypothetical protein EG244_16565 [Falsigemmobacter faecalis]
MSYTVRKSFTHNGNNYEVRSTEIGNFITIKAFKEDGTAADPFEFSVTMDVQKDAKLTNSIINPEEALVATAEEYVLNDRWGEYLKALSDLEKGSH